MARPDTLARLHPHEWLSALADRLAQNQPQVLATVVDTRGSTPRDTGARMWVGTDFSVDTIGGGHLEWKVIGSARTMLERAERNFKIQRYALGPSLGQCCGGVVWVLLEYLDHDDAAWCKQVSETLGQGGSIARTVTWPPVSVLCTDEEPGVTDGLSVADATGLPRGDATITLQRRGSQDVPTHTYMDVQENTVVDVWSASVMHVVVCGAGHIGTAIIKLLGDLPVQVTWLDPRENCWPSAIPGNVRAIQGDADDVLDMPDHAYWLVLTHNHALDLAIIDAVFRYKPFAFMGLIGSRSKKARFVSRLSRRHKPELVERICCPVGVVQTSSKQPAVIAVSVVAQLLGLTAA